MMKLSKKYYCFFLISLAISTFFARSYGAQAQTPQAFVEKLLDSGVSLLKDNTKTNEEKELLFRNIFRENFHLKSIAGSALRPGETRGEAKEKLDRYLQLFEAMVFRIYMTQMEKLSLKGFSVVRIQTLEDGAQLVQSLIDREDGLEPFKIDWILYFKDSRYWVFDVVVDGLSLGQVQKQRIQDMRQGGNLDFLIQVMEKEFGANIQKGQTPL